MYGSDSVTAVTLSIDDPKLELSSSLNYDAGGWNIIASGATGSGLGNYTIDLSDKPARTDDRQEPLTVTANNESRTYGADDSGVNVRLQHHRVSQGGCRGHVRGERHTELHAHR